MGNGDIDTLLRPTEQQHFPERVIVMQQIQYACRDSQGKIKVEADSKTYRCDPGDVGSVEGYDQFGPGTWGASGRYTSINGLVLPTFLGARAGSPERWRIVHGGVRDTISLQFLKLKSGAPSVGNLKSRDTEVYVRENCVGEPIPQFLIAADGLTMSGVKKSEVTVFQPGYRWDSIIMFPSAGRYCVINGEAPASNVSQSTPSRQLLGFVNVGAGTEVTGDPAVYVLRALIQAANNNMPALIRSKVVSDLRNGLRLSSFVPHADIADAELTGKQQLQFNINLASNPIEFQVDGKPYDPGRVDRNLQLGGVDEWTVTSNFVSHPFHIHVNPFQIVKILDPNGKDVSLPDAVDDFGSTNGKADLQYKGMKGIWKDTLWIKNVGTNGGPSGQYTIVMRTRYQRYIGEFVLHCHILDHEDQGMMQNIVIRLPNGAGGVIGAHH
jgi:FtsP/CotA-like multicopper oxidase with cupredoxin domain